MSLGRMYHHNLWSKHSIKCKCGRKVVLSGWGRDYSGKRHGHCFDCGIEWHLNINGRIYSHPIRKSKPISTAVYMPPDMNNWKMCRKCETSQPTIVRKTQICENCTYKQYGKINL